MSDANFPGDTDALDTLAFCSASSAVLFVLTGVQLNGSPVDSGELLHRVRERLGHSLGEHPDKSNLIPRAMYFAEKMIQGKTEVPIGYEDA